MKNKLFILTCENIKKCYHSHIFLCVGEVRRMGFNTNQFINIKSGTLVDGALWYVGSELKEISITDEYKEQIKKICDKPSSKRFIAKLNKN